MLNSYLVIVIGVGVVLLLMAALIIWLILRQHRLEKNYSHLMRSAEGLDFNAVLLQMATDLDVLTQAFEDAGRQSEDLAGRLFGSFNRLGLHHFEAFEGVAAHRSFALCLLDDRDNGFVLSALATRDQTRCYCKILRRGKSEEALSEEEKRALLDAQAQPVHGEQP